MVECPLKIIWFGHLLRFRSFRLWQDMVSTGVKFLSLISSSGLHLAVYDTKTNGRLEAMAGHDAHGSQHQFTGFQKYFNSYTITGRRNYVLATYASIAMIFLYFKLRPKKQTPAVTQK